MKSIEIEGVKVTLCLAIDEGLDTRDGGKWLLMCENHGVTVQDTNKARLWSNRFEVKSWCGSCRETAAA
jgi:hypothetical protein